jgi:tetratricopeptide (TPR) repeat protein
MKDRKPFKKRKTVLLFLPLLFLSLSIPYIILKRGMMLRGGDDSIYFFVARIIAEQDFSTLLTVEKNMLWTFSVGWGFISPFFIPFILYGAYRLARERDWNNLLFLSIWFFGWITLYALAIPDIDSKSRFLWCFSYPVLLLGSGGIYLFSLRAASLFSFSILGGIYFPHLFLSLYVNKFNEWFLSFDQKNEPLYFLSNFHPSLFLAKKWESLSTVPGAEFFSSAEKLLPFLVLIIIIFILREVKFEEALSTTEDALSIFLIYSHSYLYSLRGDSLSALGKPEEAISEYNKSRGIDVRWKKGVLEFQLKRSKDAASTFQYIVKQQVLAIDGRVWWRLKNEKGV